MSAPTDDDEEEVEIEQPDEWQFSEPDPESR